MTLFFMLDCEDIMETIKAFCKRKNIEVSAKRYGIDALGAMAQGLFCSLLIGTIIKTLGDQLGVPFLTDIGKYAMAVSGPAMAAVPAGRPAGGNRQKARDPDG